MWKTGKFTILVIALQIVFIILFAVYVEYDESSDVPRPMTKTQPTMKSHGNNSDDQGDHEEEQAPDPIHIDTYYPRESFIYFFVKIFLRDFSKPNI